MEVIPPAVSFSCLQDTRSDLKYTNIDGNLPINMSGLWNSSMFDFLQSRTTNALTDYKYWYSKREN